MKISKIMQDLMKNDQAQEKLHRVLGSAADLDNENTVADHMKKVFEQLINMDLQDGLSWQELEG